MINAKNPVVIYNDKQIPFTYYQLVQAKYALSILNMGMKIRNVNYKAIRRTLDLKSKNVKYALVEIEQLIIEFRNSGLTRIDNTLS